MQSAASFYSIPHKRVVGISDELSHSKKHLGSPLACGWGIEAFDCDALSHSLFSPLENAPKGLLQSSDCRWKYTPVWIKFPEAPEALSRNPKKGPDFALSREMGKERERLIVLESFNLLGYFLGRGDVT